MSFDNIRLGEAVWSLMDEALSVQQQHSVSVWPLG